MKINVTQPLKDIYTGEPLMEEGKPILFRKPIITALMANEEGVSGDEKLLRHILAVKVREEDAPEFTVEDAKKIKDLVGKHMTTLAAGQICPLLDGK